MKHRKYHQQLGETGACNKRIKEATKGIGHRYRKGATKDFFLFNSWLYSNKSTESAMEVGANFIGTVKINKKYFSWRPFENLTKDWPGVS